ncbi:hypothetical protein EJ110_NYTH13569 [Nymphaea thermarum]|nr:hypothetical protein EJ110_NYTH13569 [Nymphaea thermarum]
MFLNCLSSDEDLNEVLIPSKWRVQGKFLVSSRSKLGMAMKMEAASQIPFWSRLPELPMHLLSKSIFSGIARMLGGSSMEVDGFTRAKASGLIQLKANWPAFAPRDVSWIPFDFAVDLYVLSRRFFRTINMIEQVLGLHHRFQFTPPQQINH